MLVLKRREGQWTEITHTSGDVLRVRVYDIAGDFPGRVNLAFDDKDLNFLIQRPERAARLNPPSPIPVQADAGPPLDD